MRQLEAHHDGQRLLIFPRKVHMGKHAANWDLSVATTFGSEGLGFESLPVHHP